jgi:hypothetical protein
MLLPVTNIRPQAASLMNYFSTTKTSQNKLCLTWEPYKKGITKYIIYRQVYSDGAYGKKVKLAEISGSKRSYTDKTIELGQTYKYTIKGYKVSGTKKTLLHEDTTEVEISLKGISLYIGDENEGWSSSHGVIRGTFETEGDLLPEGVIIYRKAEGESSYQKIATITDITSHWISFKDRDVERGKTYQYKAKAYVTIDGKMTYTKCTKAKKMKVLNDEYVLEAKNISKDSDEAEELIVRVASKSAYNDTIKILTHCLYDNTSLPQPVTDESYYDGYLVTYVRDTEYRYMSSYRAMVLKAYSYDKKNWTEYTGEDTISLEPKTAVYLKFAAADGGTFVIDSTSYSSMNFAIQYDYPNGIINWEARYDGVWDASAKIGTESK